MNSVHAKSKSLLFPVEDPIQLQGPFHLKNSKLYKCEQSVPMNESFWLYDKWIFFFFLNYGAFFLKKK